LTCETFGNTLPIPKLKSFQKDLTYGRARGYTWGKQSRNGLEGGKRLNKYFYTGSIDAIAIADHTGKVAGLELASRRILEFGKGKSLAMCSNRTSGVREISEKRSMHGSVIIMELLLELG
jgi:hypothetical protein